jgi:hypothetical protein
MDKKRERKSVIWFGCLYRLWELLNFCQKFKIGNLLKVDKYTIIGLNCSQLTKDILQKNFNLLMEKLEKVPTG